MDKNTQYYLERATWIIGDYYSQFGGSNRPETMQESDVFAYIICRVLTKIGFDDALKPFINNHISTSLGQRESEKVAELLENIEVNDQNLEHDLIKYFSIWDEKLKSRPYEKRSNWDELGKFVEHLDTQEIY